MSKPKFSDEACTVVANQDSIILLASSVTKLTILLGAAQKGKPDGCSHTNAIWKNQTAVRPPKESKSVVTQICTTIYSKVKRNWPETVPRLWSLEDELWRDSAQDDLCMARKESLCQRKDIELTTSSAPGQLWYSLKESVGNWTMYICVVLCHLDQNLHEVIHSTLLFLLLSNPCLHMIPVFAIYEMLLLQNCWKRCNDLQNLIRHNNFQEYIMQHEKP